MKKKEIFLAANGILIAVLAIWAGFWTSTAQLQLDKFDKSNPPPLASQWPVAYGLAYLSWAILSSLLAFVIAFLYRKEKEEVPRFANSLFLTAIIISVGEILVQLVPTIVKILRGKDFIGPLYTFKFTFIEELVIIVILPILLPILIYFAPNLFHILRLKKVQTFINDYKRKRKFR